MAEWVLAVERAYVAAATGELDPRPRGADRELAMRARAAAAAVASRFLAVGTPRSIAFVFDVDPEVDEAILTLEAHRTWFAPVDVRCAGGSPGAEDRIGGRAVSIDEALAADIVNIHGAVRASARQIRRGTHINMLGASSCIDDELRAIATCFDEVTGLPALAAGLIDGRQLDEITVFFAGDAGHAVAALARRT